MSGLLSLANWIMLVTLPLLMLLFDAILSRKYPVANRLKLWFLFVVEFGYPFAYLIMCGNWYIILGIIL
jgi:hypothetical protein